MPHRIRTIDEDWYELSFDHLYPIIYAHRTLETARRESIFCARKTGMNMQDTVLDLCCGSGRHVLHLADHARLVIGLDYSRDLLEIAQETLGASAPLIRGDMRRLPFHNVFDVIVNFFTSFGYFAQREENLAVVSSIAAALKPEGRFFIDHINRQWAEENLQTESSRTVDGFQIRERRWIDRDEHRVNKVTLVSKNGHEITHKGESVKLYTPEEFMALLGDGGLIVEHLFGDYTGAKMDDSHPRMIAVGRKA